MNKVVLDSYAFLRFSQDEEGAGRVEEILYGAQRGEIHAYMSEINLGEVYYITIRRLGKNLARRFLDHLLTLPVEVVAPSSDIILSASEVKAQFAISYADCFAVATALKYSASIITGDPEFRLVETLVKIDWIGGAAGGSKKRR
jgi:predicted nucleic acid-binding protein